MKKNREIWEEGKKTWTTLEAVEIVEKSEIVEIGEGVENLGNYSRTSIKVGEL